MGHGGAEVEEMGPGGAGGWVMGHGGAGGDAMGVAGAVGSADSFAERFEEGAFYLAGAEDIGDADGAIDRGADEVGCEV